MQYNNNKTPFSNKYSNQNNKKILDAIDELQEEVDTLSSSLDGVSSSLASKADAQTTASDIQSINSNISSLSNALTSLRDDIKSGDIGKIDDIEVDNISVNDEIKAKSYKWKEGEELSINKVLVPKNGSIYFVYSSIKTALIQYNASNNFIVLSSSNGFVKYGNYNNYVAFTVSESSYINYIGDISITSGNITGEVLTKAGTTVVGNLYASLQEANINNLTVANLSAEVIAGDEVRADNITADSVTADEITADIGNIEDLESDSAKIKELNTSQINTKVDIENIGYTIIPEHQIGTEYLVVVPETNGTWNLELPGYFKATIIKTKDAAVVTYNRASTTALSKVEVKNGKLYFFTEGYGKLYFANDSLENDNTVATYTENPPYTEPDETLELTANNGTVNTTRAYFNNVTIYGSMSIRDYSADKINTSKNDTDATFYPTFVDSNNENEDAEKLYTNDTLTLNPYEGKVTTCILCASDCVETPLVNADLVCADICSDVINTNCINSNTITNTGNVGTCNINVTSCATIRDLNVAEQTETGSLVVNNDAFIKGDLWVDGTTHTVDEETVTTQSDTIVLRANNDTSLGDNLSGIIINKYNGTDDLGIVTDSDGTLRVGTGTGTETSYPTISYNSTTNKWYTDPTDPTTEVTPIGNLTSWATKTEDGPYTNYTNAVFTVFDKTSLEPVMTRDESTDMTNGQIVCWNSTENKAKTTNCISDNVTFAKCVDIECNLTVDNSICACCNVDTPTVNADTVNVCCCLTACNAMFTDSVTVCCDFRVCGSAIIHGLTSDCVAVQENISNHNMYPTFVCRNNAQQQGELMFTDCDLYYNPFTNTLVSPNIGFNIACGDHVIADGAISCFCGICTKYNIEMYEDDWGCCTGYIFCNGSACWGGEWCFCNNVCIDKCTHMNGPLIISANAAQNNYDEGIRINASTSCYSTLTIGTTGDCGIATGFWIGTNCCLFEDKLYVNYHSSSANSYFQGNSDGTVTWTGNVNGTSERATCLTDGTVTVKAECNNELNIYPSGGNCTWINYRGGSDTVLIGNGGGAGCFGTLCACTVVAANLTGTATNATNADKALCLTDGTAVFRAERINEFNMYPGGGDYTGGWINYRGGVNTVYIGNGSTSLGTLVADYICGNNFATTGSFVKHQSDVAANTNLAGFVMYNTTAGQGYTGGPYVGHLNANHDGWWGYATFGMYNAENDTVCTPICVDISGTLFTHGILADGNVTASNTFYSSCCTGLALCEILGGAVWLGESSIAIGNGVGWSESNCCVISIGCSAYAGAYCSIAIGPSAHVSRASSTALGPSACAGGSSSTALGPSAHANETLSIAIGPNATANRQYSVAIGNQALTQAYGSNTFVDFCVKTEDTRLKTVSWYCGAMQCDIFNAIAGGMDLTWVGGQCIPENSLYFSAIGAFGNHEISVFKFDKCESPRNIDFGTNGNDYFCTIYEGCTATVSRPGMMLLLGSR